MRAGVQVCLGIICAIQFLTIAHAAAAPSSQQVVVFLDFYRRWDTLDQDHAAEAARQILHGVHDFEAFALKAPRDSEARRLFLLHFASFEDAAQLVRTGEMNEQLLYEGWYALPDSWIKAKPYIEGLRREMNQPELLEGLEWLAGRADRYWLEQKEHPTHWQPVDRPPTKGDRAYDSDRLDAELRKEGIEMISPHRKGR
ncbi:MAG TPA: hypothetical protein VET48_12725, partial [Steroidobacteraceae bacterium]|nr:hypothetical protein [Steroidobacteraceae bacterium]